MKTSVTSYSFGGYFAEDRLGYLGIINKAKVQKVTTLTT